MKYKSDAQLKFCEKLVILNNRAVGMLTRIYNMKKACSDIKSRPYFLNDKFLDVAITQIMKRFPVIDLKRNSAAIASVDEIKSEIIKSLSLYYYTLADLLDLKDAILQLLTTMDANQTKLDISVNFDLTVAYLNLIINFVSLMILLSRIDDRKIVLGLFTTAYDLLHSTCEACFPRLGQMVVDYENPIKKLSEDLGPLYRLIQSALESLREIYLRRNISADKQREAAIISLLSNPKQMHYAAQTNTIACEYLSLDIMDKWIIFGVTMCHKILLNESAMFELYYRALQHGLVLKIFRNESILIYPMVQQLFESVKGYGKILNELKELHSVTLQSCAFIHAHRRQFLRAALKELTLIFSDQPGLLGPKILFVWMGLCFARDEVLWLLRHAEVWPQIFHNYSAANKKVATKVGIENALTDKFLPELLFYMNELRSLVTKHADSISDYYIKYVLDYDFVLLAELVQEGVFRSVMNENDLAIIYSCLDSLGKVAENNLDLRAIRLDWFRIQANTSLYRSTFKLQNHMQFTFAMNTTIFHLRQVDELEELLRETSDLSIYCFYPHLFDAHLKQCLNFPLQSRYVIVYPQLTSHFVNSLHEMCPEERNFIVDRGLIACNVALEEIVRRIADVINQMAESELELITSISPHSCAKIIAFAYQQQPSNNKHRQNGTQDVKMPGQESIRNSSQPLSQSDKNSLYLTELSFALSRFNELNVSNHIFAPREYLTQCLERQILLNLVQFAHYTQKDKPELTPRRPSEVLAFLNAQLNILQTLDISFPFDLPRLINDTMLQQSQMMDSQDNETLTSVYCKWYLEVLLRKKNLIYSEHFRDFANNPYSKISTSPATNFLKADQYSDRTELKALAQLIGPLGIKHIEEKLVWNVAAQVVELFKIVREHRESLHVARINYDKPEKIKEVVAQLSQSIDTISKDNRRSTVGSTLNIDTIYAQTTNQGNTTSSTQEKLHKRENPLELLLQKIISIGEMIAFRDLLFEALNDVMNSRCSFLVSTVDVLVNNAVDEVEKINISELCAACGLKIDHMDLALVTAIQRQSQANGFTDPDEHYILSCLLLVFVAISLPKLAVSKLSLFLASFVACQNNSHTIPSAVNAIASALFFLHRRGDLHERMREFLALASNGLLQIENISDINFMPQYHSLYILIERIVRSSPYLNFGLLESCFPYTLIRSAYSSIYSQQGSSDQWTLGFGYQFSNQRN